MAKYSFSAQGGIEIDFGGVKPDVSIRNKMKAVRYRWNPQKMVWWAYKSAEALAVAKEICGEESDVKNLEIKRVAESVHNTRGPVKITPPDDYALKIKIKDIISASNAQLQQWESQLKEYVNSIMSEDNVDHAGEAVGKRQESVWMDCFRFIATNLSPLDVWKQDFELVFEYSLPGTIHERPDVLLLTNTAVISLEFKKKEAPQVDSNKDDVAQAIRYKEQIENHHNVTRKKHMEVRSFLVCTHPKAFSGVLRGVEILTQKDFFQAIDKLLERETPCSFIDDWLASSKTEMPDMLEAIDIMYREGRIPYISDVNKKCVDSVNGYIDGARKNREKILILINGVPGAGKTAVGQSVVYTQNKGGKPNAVYLSGNGPLVEVLQYQIDQVGSQKHIGENAIQDMKQFKAEYFDRNNTLINRKIPQQSILIFDEAQRAWDTAKMNKGYSEPEGLFRVGEKIYKERGYAVVVGLYGNGQVIYKGEETGISLWNDALEAHSDWKVVASQELINKIDGAEGRKITDENMFLPISLRADFIDCSRWVEQVIGRSNSSAELAKKELEKLQKTSMRICVTRDFSKVQERADEISKDHPDWKYGILISNFAEQNVIQKALPGWIIKYRKAPNAVSNGEYGLWFAGGCMNLDKACSVYGNQGLELDCPIILFGGEYIRENGKWIARGNTYDYYKNSNAYEDIDTIVENNFRVLLTRARKEMTLLIPREPILDKTYQYFMDMGCDEL